MLGFAIVAGGLGTAMTLPNTFISGTAISSSAVNANFAAIKDAIDALEARMSGAQVRVSGTCSGAQAIQSIGANGTVACGGGAVTSVGATSPVTSSGGTQPTIALAACPAGQVLRANGSGWACAPQNSAFKLARLTTPSSPSGFTTTNMLALTLTAPADGSVLLVGTGYCTSSTLVSFQFDVSIQESPTGNCSFSCPAYPCDKSHCAFFVTVHGPTRRWRASRAEGEAEVMAQGRWCGVRESRA